jgi:polyisoprenoid-binding protein YceI
MRTLRQTVLGFGVLALGWSGGATGQPRPVDASKSTATLQVKKSGVFSAFAHDHEIAAPLAGGTVDASGRTVELRFNSAALQVRDHGVSEKDRAEIQTTMLGSEVLDAQRYPEISFRSTSVVEAGDGAWNVQGNLTLHGQTKPVTAEVRGQSGHYLGTVRLRQTEFGITPIKIAGGTVRVKDEVRIDFDIQLAR